MTLIRFATLAPEGSTWMQYMRAMDEEIRQLSNNEIGFKFYPNMTMGDEKDVVRKMRLGQLQAAGFTGFGLGEILPEIRILELPYLFDNDAEIDYVTSRMEQHFKPVLEDKGFVLLGWADVGLVYFLANNPVAEPEHLKGLKVWMWEGDPLARAFFKELGQSPIPLSITDVHLSLQTGLINAVYCSPLAALALQWFTKLSYISDMPFTNAVGAVLMDKKTFDKLSAQQRELLLGVASRNLRRLLIKSREDNREAYLQLIKEGLQVVPSTPEQRSEMRTVGKGVHKRLAGALYSQDLLSELKGYLTEFREQRGKQPSE